MTNFTPWPALLGGVLIGLASALLMLLNGRVAGISGILAGVLRPVREDVAWRVLFLVGLLAGGMVTAIAAPSVAARSAPAVSLPTLLIGGVLVGFGVRLGNGCTSGHGVCGIGRLAPRSIVATVTFIATAALTVFALRHA